MNGATSGYELLVRRPAPPPETVPLLRRAWDAHRTEDWLLNAAWPQGCSAPGEHLTAAGTDGAGRWAVHDGERLRAHDCEWLRARQRGPDLPADLVAHALAKLASARRADAAAG